MSVSCHACYFFEALNSTCRFTSPSTFHIDPMNRINAFWPKVETHDWCGEWVDKHGLQDILEAKPHAPLPAPPEQSQGQIISSAPPEPEPRKLDLLDELPPKPRGRKPKA